MRLPPCAMVWSDFMKVINEKDYKFVKKQGKYYKFISNPNKTNFDSEILLVERARYIQEDGKVKYFDYVRDLA